ncbi:MAG: IPExxxVDY family protein [Bacteroidales bacterium]|nr:IPExxxVDY family protein [Bacteroidales bacterium]
MIKKIKLDYKPDFDFLLIAIVSFEKDYKLVWDINNSLNFDFVREDDYKVFNTKSKSEQTFPSFVFKNHDQYINYRLLTNKSDQGFLLDELKNIDYLLLIRGDFLEEYDKIFQKKLQKLQSVQSAFIIEVKKLKAKDRLLEE